MKEIYAHGLANSQQLLGVDGGFEEYLLYGPRMDMDAVGEPLVSVPLSPELFPDDLSYMYLHKKPRAFCGVRGSAIPVTKTKKLAIYRERSAS